MLAVILLRINAKLILTDPQPRVNGLAVFLAVFVERVCATNKLCNQVGNKVKLHRIEIGKAKKIALLERVYDLTIPQYATFVKTMQTYYKLQGNMRVKIPHLGVLPVMA